MNANHAALGFQQADPTEVLLNPHPPAELLAALESEHLGPPIPLPDGYQVAPVMTPRDWFAAAALSGYLAHPYAASRMNPDQLAGYAFRFAEAMAEEKRRRDGKGGVG